MKKLICLFLAVTMLFSISLPKQVTAQEGEKLEIQFENYDASFPTIDGEAATTTADGSKEAVILIFGATTCGMTGLTVKGISESGWADSAKASVIYVDINGADAAEVGKFAKQWGSSKLAYCSDPNGTNFDLVKRYMMRGGHTHGTILMPITVLIDADNTVQCIFTQYRSADVIYEAVSQFASLSNRDPKRDDCTAGWDNIGADDNPADEEALQVLKVPGTLHYEEVDTVLGIVNETRAAAGAAALWPDASLTETAMQRAMELSLYYSHTRPNGKDCFTLFRDSGGRGENIAVGYSSAQEVMQAWNNSPGHYGNIVEAEFQSIGVGCFADSGGTLYWVQCFDKMPAAAPDQKDTCDAVGVIPIRQSAITLKTDASVEIGCSGAQTELNMDVYNVNKQWIMSQTKLSPENFEFNSSNPVVAKVDEKGVITPKAVGTAVITASLKSNPTIQASRTITKKTHSYRETVVAPTYTAQGYTVHTCIFCGSSYQDQWIPPLTQPQDSDAANPGSGAGNPGDGSGKPNVSEPEESGGLPGGGSQNPPGAAGDANQNPSGGLSENADNQGGLLFDPASVSIQLSSASVTYNGKSQQPAVVVRRQDGSVIGSENYTVSYRDNKNVGIAAVTVTFRGSYAGSLIKTFTILPKGTSISKLTAGKKGFIAKWKKQSAQTSGYEIQYSTSRKFTKKTTGTTTVKKSGTTSAKVKKLKARKKYYVRVRTFKTVKIDGKTTKLYSVWSKNRTVLTKK